MHEAEARVLTKVARPAEFDKETKPRTSGSQNETCWMERANKTMGTRILLYMRSSGVQVQVLAESGLV